MTKEVSTLWAEYPMGVVYLQWHCCCMIKCAQSAQQNPVLDCSTGNKYKGHNAGLAHTAGIMSLQLAWWRREYHIQIEPRSPSKHQVPAVALLLLLVMETLRVLLYCINPSAAQCLCSNIPLHAVFMLEACTTYLQGPHKSQLVSSQFRPVWCLSSWWRRNPFSVSTARTHRPEECLHWTGLLDITVTLFCCKSFSPHMESNVTTWDSLTWFSCSPDQIYYLALFVANLNTYFVALDVKLSQCSEISVQCFFKVRQNWAHDSH